jgi:uncharacterized protein (TIGR00255 family)
MTGRGSGKGKRAHGEDSGPPSSDAPLTTRSMTGFGRARVERDGIALEVEIRSWNSRFLDTVFKLPRLYLDFEFELRTLLAERLSRGKVELSVTRRVTSSGSAEPEVRRERIVAIDELFQSLCAELGIPLGEGRTELLRSLILSREVVDFGEGLTDSELERELLLEGAKAAVEALKTMRAAEGRRLGEDMLARLERLREIRTEIAARVEGGAERTRERLTERLKKLPVGVDVDPSRLAAEVALIAERSDVSEEITRLGIHLDEFSQLLRRPGSEGKKGDFLSQELLREVNTISSKAQDAAVQHLVVDAKAEIEKIREQIQNIE